jgi:hypothetical protein
MTWYYVHTIDHCTKGTSFRNALLGTAANKIWLSIGTTVTDETISLPEFISCHLLRRPQNPSLKTPWWDFRFSRRRIWRWLVFCDVVPCSLVETDRSSRGAYCLQHLVIAKDSSPWRHRHPQLDVRLSVTSELSAHEFSPSAFTNAMK